MATLASFAATCKDNGVNFEEWLADVLVRIDSTPPADSPNCFPMSGSRQGRTPKGIFSRIFNNAAFFMPGKQGNRG